MDRLLEVRRLSKSFGGVMAVLNVDLMVKHGEIVAVIGPNGAGKSTFLNLLTGVYTPQAGDVIFDRVNLAKMKPHQIAQLGMTRTFQNVKLLYDLTVLENIALGANYLDKTNIFEVLFGFSKNKKDKQRAIQVAMEKLEYMGLENTIDPYEIAGNIPYGQQRLVEVARALAMDPKLLLLDEPAAGLTHKEALQLVEIVKKVSSNGTAVIIIEHNMDVIMNVAHKIMVLDYGETIAEGTPKQIQANEQVIAAYLG